MNPESTSKPDNDHFHPDFPIAPALVEPLFHLTCEYFANFRDPGGPDGDISAIPVFLEQVFDLCHRHNDETSRFNLVLRVQALVTMLRSFEPGITPAQLWQTNGFNLTVPSARLIRAALTAPWPPVEAGEDPTTIATALRESWTALVDNWSAAALRTAADPTSTSNLLH